MTYNELVGKIAKRADELSVQSMPLLRLSHLDNTEGTKSGWQWKGLSRADLIESILYDEFDIEFDKSLEEEA